MQFSTFFAFFAVVTLSVLAAPGITKAEHQRREMITRQEVDSASPGSCLGTDRLGTSVVAIANGSTGCILGPKSGQTTIIMCIDSYSNNLKTCGHFTTCVPGDNGSPATCNFFT